MSAIQMRCWDFLHKIRYKNNIIYSEEETTETAFEKAVIGNDAGKMGLLKLMPESTNTEDWYNYLFLLYCLYCKNK